MRTYDNYKESGIEWIGEIPMHWEAKKIKFSDEIIMGQSPSSDDYIDDENGLPFLQGNADFTDLFPLPRIYCNTANKITQENDILLSVRAPIGAINISDKKYGIGRGLCAIRTINSNYKFLYYHSLIQTEELNSIGTGSTYTAISIDDVRNSYFVLPPLSEQTAIANYLDTKTTEIDQTIADKEALINLFEEEKKALINEVVTKGLNPNVKLKPSGIDWLGDIAEHWNYIAIKRVVEIKVTDGPHESPEFVEEGVPFISAEAIKENNIDFNFCRGYITKETDELYSKKCKPKKNDILLIKSGSTTGRVAMVNTDLNFNIWSPLALIRSNMNLIVPVFFYYSILSEQFKKLIELFWSFGTQPNIGMNVIENLKVALPPLDEQILIIQHIEKETTKINEKINLTKQEIELLKEYRKALIFEAVTGKICVV